MRGENKQSITEKIESDKKKEITKGKKDTKTKPITRNPWEAEIDTVENKLVG